jgi:predicted amino acid-binding ACT domain protein
MAITVKKVTLWRAEIDNRTGTLAAVLEPLAATKASLQVVMGYRFPGNPARAAVELSPVSGKKPQAAARSAGLSPATQPALLVTGDDRPGVGATMSRALADAGINMDFLVALVIGRKFSTVIGFESDADAARAVAILKKALAKRKG